MFGEIMRFFSLSGEKNISGIHHFTDLAKVGKVIE
jgi:hypothetical protein